MKPCIGKGATLLVVLLGFLPFAQVSAQMYRCGNTYQDRPCEAAQPGKALTGGSLKAKAADSSMAASPAAAMHPVCAQRGNEAQKIVWTREGGMTEEKSLAAETNPERRKLIADVYRVRGTAPQVRARIEAECQEEMAEKARALALHDAMVRAGALPGKPVTAPGQSPEEMAAEAKLKAKQAEQRDAVAKKARCDNLNAQLESIRAQQRSGGNRAYMDNLDRRRADVDRDLRNASC